MTGLHGRGIGGWDTFPENSSEDYMMGESKRFPREVMIPPGRCVYYWLGCTRARYSRNYCRPHFDQAREWGDLAPFEPAPTRYCEVCNERKSTRRSKQLYDRWLCGKCIAKQFGVKYRAENKEQERLRKKAWRDRNREHYREYSRAAAARGRARKRSQLAEAA